MRKSMLDYIEKNSKKRDVNLKYDFMPNLLEVIERPAHKAGSIIIWSIFILVAFAIVWACISKVEITVSANGVLQTVEDEMLIISKAEYNIDTINVEVGQRVNKGDVLIQLNPEKLNEEQQALQEKLNNYKSIIDVCTKIINKEDISNLDLNAYDMETKQTIKEIVEEYNDTMELIEEYKQTSFGDYLQETENSYYEEIDGKIESYQSMYDEIGEEIEDVSSRIDEAIVKAPYDGIVYQIFIQETDVKVGEEQPLISIIEVDGPLEMKCYVNNKDIADISLNQEVNVKLDAYPYGDYGTIDGRITYIGDMSQNIEGIGNAVMIKVTISDPDFKEKVFPGLTGIADINIGERRIVEYFIGPITDALRESVREK